MRRVHSPLTVCNSSKRAANSRRLSHSQWHMLILIPATCVHSFTRVHHAVGALVFSVRPTPSVSAFWVDTVETVVPPGISSDSAGACSVECSRRKGGPGLEAFGMGEAQLRPTRGVTLSPNRIPMPTGWKRPREILAAAAISTHRGHRPARPPKPRHPQPNIPFKTRRTKRPTSLVGGIVRGTNNVGVVGASGIYDLRFDVSNS